jgi:hypothetical protein
VEKKQSVELTDNNQVPFRRYNSFHVLPDIGTEIANIERKIRKSHKQRKKRLFKISNKKVNVFTLTQALNTCFEKDVE